MLSSVFFAESGLKKSGEITLLDNHGRKWPSYLVMTGKPGQKYFYIRKGWREMCKANGVKVNDSFVFELICEAANPIFKFHSKVNPPTPTFYSLACVVKLKSKACIREAITHSCFLSYVSD